LTGSAGEPGTGGLAGAPQPGLSAGRVGRPHGLDGSFYVTRPRARLLTLGTTVTIAGREAEIVRRAGTEQRPIVRLHGVADREAAEALRGVELTVPRSEAPALGEGEWWAHELEGCAVVDGGVRLGTVTKLIELPSCEAIEVARPGGGAPVLVPMVKAAVRRVAVADGLIEVDLDFLGLAEPPGGSDGPPAPGAPR
jgi:16S rRNA processing protein RimM